MWLIIFFGLLMMALSGLMIVKPQAFATSIITFSQKAYFHAFEITSRSFFGLVFVYYAPQTQASIVNAIFGYLMIFAAIFLLVIGAKRHRTFALWSAQYFCHKFRLAGVGSLAFGAYIIYSACA